MQTPKIEDRSAFETKLVATFASGACAICKGRFAEKEVYLSLHAHEFKGTCTGTGKVWRVALRQTGFTMRNSVVFFLTKGQISVLAAASSLDPQWIGKGLTPTTSGICF